MLDNTNGKDICSWSKDELVFWSILYFYLNSSSHVQGDMTQTELTLA